MPAPATPRQTVFAGLGPAPAPSYGTMFMHNVLFRMCEGATERVRDDALRLMAAMCQNAPGIIEWHVAESADDRKGFIIGEIIVFASRKEFEELKLTPGYRECVDFIRYWAEWDISDYEFPAR